MDYLDLLDKAQKEMPEEISGQDRFKCSNIKGHIEGNKTILVNLKQISKELDREEQGILKYLLRELATPGKINGERVILGTKVSAKLINTKLKKYISEYVICSECSKPDTKLEKEKEITYIKCLACGSKKPIRTI